MPFTAPQYDHLCEFNQSAVVDPSTSTLYCVNNYYYPQSLYYRRPVLWGPYNRPGWRRGPYHRHHRHHGHYEHHGRRHGHRTPDRRISGGRVSERQ